MARSSVISSLVNHLSGGRLKYGWYDSHFRSDESPIFVGGCPRSGTTLLCSLLDAHPNIYLGVETGLMLDAREPIGLQHRTGLAIDTLQAAYRESESYPEFTEKVLKHLAVNNTKAIWGDKSPGNVNAIERIFHYFPKARFIHVIRDGRDVVCSMRTYRPAFGFKYEDVNPWGECISKWSKWVTNGIAWRGYPNYYEILYEDLVTDPESSLRVLFNFLNIEWSTQILDPLNRRGVSSHPGVTREIDPKGYGRWRSDLPAEARVLFQGAPDALLKTLRYDMK